MIIVYQELPAFIISTLLGTYLHKISGKPYLSWPFDSRILYPTQGLIRQKKTYPEFLGAIKKGKVRGRKNKGGTKEDQLEPDHGKNNEETKRKGPLL